MEPLKHTSNLEEYNKLLDEEIAEQEPPYPIWKESKKLHDSFVEADYWRRVNKLYPLTKNPKFMAEPQKIRVNAMLNVIYLRFILFNIFLLLCLWSS